MSGKIKKWLEKLKVGESIARLRGEQVHVGNNFSQQQYVEQSDKVSEEEGNEDVVDSLRVD